MRIYKYEAKFELCSSGRKKRTTTNKLTMLPHTATIQRVENTLTFYTQNKPKKYKKEVQNAAAI